MSSHQNAPLAPMRRWARTILSGQRSKALAARELRRAGVSPRRKASRVMTGKGTKRKPIAIAAACRNRGLKHTRTKPCTPKTNSKAERHTRKVLR